ncbi:hypothetical protein LSH36_54g05031 [Paralvinella palmiformis]|uniref:Potassium channel domain-containing protein n=1 Tax=Paralvinella palmiformis TaxID=53620 RepID=A0AAD9NCP4_9ANNE|nr:hypothetical protein LSH36_54g05031 [Paralvinella palmiformis]
MKQLTCMVVVLVTVAYITIGGIVFHVLEYDNETSVRNNANEYFLRFLKNKTCLGQEEMQELLKMTLEAYKTGYLVSNDTISESNWDFYSSIFFAMTVVTTIGYGNISPSTVPGVIFCTAFALVGIPLFLVTAAAIGDRLYWITKKSQNCCFGKKRDGSRSVGAKVCGDTFYIVIGVGLLIFVPGLIFMIMEEWSFLEGSYYSFITLTTIGFGDYVAGTKEKHDYKGFRGIYRLCVAAWIFIGLSWMGGAISAIQESYSKRLESNDSDTASRSVASKNSQDDSRNQRDLMRVYSMDSGYSGTNGIKVQNQYNRQTSADSAWNSLPCDDTDSTPDIYLTKVGKHEC